MTGSFCERRRNLRARPSLSGDVTIAAYAVLDSREPSDAGGSIDVGPANWSAVGAT